MHLLLSLSSLVTYHNVDSPLAFPNIVFIIDLKHVVSHLSLIQKPYSLTVLTISHYNFSNEMTGTAFALWRGIFGSDEVDEDATHSWF